jgi:DNA repair photolyase
MLAPILDTKARRILSPVSGFLAQAGFTHSLTPARNCTFGCTYCYVPTMRVQAGLRPDDWNHWGEFTTFKTNARELLKRELRPDQIIYCSPLTDPYQPAEMAQSLMPEILEAIYIHPPKIFVLQTRSPYILRDAHLLQAVAEHTDLRISFSLTTDNDRIRKLFEPRCQSIPDRLEAMRTLRDAGLNVYATLAPLLPCDPAALARLALDVTDNNILCDPFHTRQNKARGATTREAAFRILEAQSLTHWLDENTQAQVLATIQNEVESAGRQFATGPKAFQWLTQPLTQQKSSPASTSPLPTRKRRSSRQTPPPAKS